MTKRLRGCSTTHSVHHTFAVGRCLWLWARDRFRFLRDGGVARYVLDALTAMPDEHAASCPRRLDGRQRLLGVRHVRRLAALVVGVVDHVRCALSPAAGLREQGTCRR